MNITMSNSSKKIWRVGLSSFVLSAAMLTTAQATVSQSPLLLGGGDVPGNLVLTPSVEFPTVISIANLGDYNLNASYAGYFDSDKCYEYKDVVIPDITKLHNYEGYSNKGYFAPVNYDFKNSKDKDCGGSLWAGHYLNWATMQTIDPFRQALTGGLRVVDTPTRTILEKATRHNRSSSFHRWIWPSEAKLVTPFGDDIGSGTLDSQVGINTNPSDGTLESHGNNFQLNKAFRVYHKNVQLGETKWPVFYYNVRVEVCVKGMEEANCKQYSQGSKPEGLLQEYSDNIRYSIFSYLNVSNYHIDGGVMRAPQDYIGPLRRSPGITDNEAKEWDPTTGVLIKNPRKESIGNSGVINYLNKFGEISNQHKSYDPVSELYYAAIRYLRGKPNLSDYSSDGNTDQKKDYFPVITNWGDYPAIQYSCQKNSILGIGDVNTHKDHDLLPPDDNSFMSPDGLAGYTQKIFDLETVGKAATAEFSGRGNSAYIAGLAYFANTGDLRPDLPGKQRASTYWVDVRENQVLEGRKRNQYWLAAKYGGFDVPNNYTFGTPLQEGWWYTNGEMLAANYKRADNFFVASDATNMVNSLREAFAKIASDVQSSTTTLASSSDRLIEGTTLFQTGVNSQYWSGDLKTVELNLDGSAKTPAWNAADYLDGLTNTQLNDRNILSVKGHSTTTNLAKTGIDFEWSSLTSEQQAVLGSEDVLNYLRGLRTKEAPSGTYRERGSRLGDILNSDPQYVYQQNYGFTRLRGWPGDVAAKYKEFRESSAYQNRKPMVIVGANDGMLHGFDARLEGQGEELFAYVPYGAYEHLAELTDPDYVHRYYVDGTPRISDAWLGNRWATLAVGSMGAGGKGVFALDITNVASKASVKDSNVLWEFNHPKMGYAMGQPALVALPNQKFGVIVSSGYHDSSAAPEKGYVWILDAASGEMIKEIELDTPGNLGAVLPVTLTGKQEAERLYVADTTGNVFRIDLKGSDTSGWGIPASLWGGPLAQVKDDADNAQAITAPLTAAFNDKGQLMLFFGTGSYYRIGDNEIPTNPLVDSVYGLIDTGTFIDGRSSLQKQEIIYESTQGTELHRVVSDNVMATGKLGWYLDLAWLASSGGTGPKGERVISRAQIRGGRVQFATMTPEEDPCAGGGTSMNLVLDMTNGARLNYSYFDINSDGAFNESDFITLSNGDKVAVSGRSYLDGGVVKGWTHLDGDGFGMDISSPENAERTFSRYSYKRTAWREIGSDDE